MSQTRKPPQENIAFTAAWRWRMVRQRVVVPRPKIKPVDASHLAQTMTISNRGQHLLSRLRSFLKLSIAELIMALLNMDYITVLSSDQCEYFANHGAVEILFDILKGSYKAFGVDRGIELCLSVILNLYQSPKTADIVWKDTLASKGIEHLFELMMKYGVEKTSTVFCKAATVIWVFAKDPKKVEVIKKTDNVLATIKYIAKNFDKTKQQPAPSTSKKTKSAATTKKFPALKPNWGNYNNDPRAFDDKSFAFDSVMDVLKLKT